MFAARTFGTLVLSIAVVVVWLAGLGVRPVLAAPQEVGPLIVQLRTAADDETREKAAKELGKLGDPRAVPALEQAAVYDSDGTVRNEARKSALKIIDKGPSRDTVVATNDPVGRLMGLVIEAKKGGDREAAAAELARIGDPRAVRALELAAVFDRNEDVRDAARKAAISIRGRIPAAPTTAPAAPAPAQAVPPAPAQPMQAPVAPGTLAPAPPPQFDPGVPGTPAGPPPIPQQGQLDSPYPQPAPGYGAAGQDAGNNPPNGSAGVYPPPAVYPAPPPVVVQQPVVVQRPVYVAPPPYYYYYYPPPPTYYYVSPRPAFDISVGFGFGFGSFGHHRHH